MYTTVVDSQLHKVTVTGNVEVDVLIKKLERTGKRVEIWPPEKPTKEKEQVKENGGGGGGKNNGGNDKKVKEKGKEPKPSGGNADEPGAGKPTSKSADAVARKASNGKKAEDGSSITTAPQEEKKKQKQQPGRDDDGDSGGDMQRAKHNSGGDGGKKKGKKNQNENAVGNTNGTADGGKDVTSAASPSNMKPYQAGYPQFPMYLPTPVYAMSYKMTNPTPSYGYYAAPPPEPMPFNNYLYSNSNYYPAVADYNYHYPPTGYGVSLLPASSGSSYDDLSEENANACSVM